MEVRLKKIPTRYDMSFLVGGDNPILRVRCKPCPDAKTALRVVEELEQCMLSKMNCIGLAANQVGIDCAVAIIRLPGVKIDLINPSVIATDGLFVSTEEGCMSFPGRRFNVPRFTIFKIENFAVWPSGQNALPMECIGTNPYHSPHKSSSAPIDSRLVAQTIVFNHNQPIEALGSFISIAAQHECDHLFGVVLPSKEGVQEIAGAPVESAGLAKVGRNDPCPCGSGRKYKKCCLANIKG